MISKTYGERYIVKTNPISVRKVEAVTGGVVNDTYLNETTCLNELELLALTGKMHIMSVQNYGRLLSEEDVDRAVNYVLELKKKNIST